MTAEQAIYRALRRFNPLMADIATEAGVEPFLAALRAAGWAVVPVVPTEAMMSAGSEAIMDHDPGWTDATRGVWDAMLAAAERS